MNNLRSNNEQPVRIGVVGHANTGKTSLIRTLLRDSGFGDVADYAGTTRHVEAIGIKVDGKEQIQLFDTPGIEDSMALMEIWEGLVFPESIKGAQDKYEYFIKQLAKDQSFEQENKVLKQALTSDLLLYVIDARLPFLGKFQDELALLKHLGKPLIPVLNFIDTNPDNVEVWRRKLKDEHLHAVVEYDTVAFTFESEQRLYEKMQSLLESRYEQLNRVLKQSKNRYQRRINAGVNAIAELIIDVSAYRQIVSELSESKVIEDMQDKVRDREQSCVEQLLQAFGFDNDDVVAEFLPIRNGRWERDLFDPGALKEFGVKTGADAAKGAVVGGGIDLMVGGLSMGAGAAIGALAGAVLGTVNRYGRTIWETVSGTSYVCIDIATIELLYVRQLYLCQCLIRRGHASQTPLTIAEQIIFDGKDVLYNSVATLRSHPAWSNLSSKRTIFPTEDVDEIRFKENFSKKIEKFLVR